MLRCILAIWLLPIAVLAQTPNVSSFVLASSNQIFKLVIEPELSPLRINKMHNWTIDLTSSDGVALIDARISISGGMPEHNHGLPTSPQISSTSTPGRYVAQGIRFHMPGSWEISLNINHKGKTDTVSLKFNL